jgi:hypothetical protein
MAEFYRARQTGRDGNELGAGRRWVRTIRLLGAATLLLACTGIATAGAAQASQPATATGSTWKIEPTPNPAGAEISVLSAVSCSSGRACTAVGSYTSSASSPGFALAERWNGTSWQVQPTAKVTGAASPELFGVSCASANACTAVGTAFRTAESRDVNLAEAWNGRSWRVQAIPNPKGATDSALYAVSCTSASACTAAGVYDNAAGLPRAMTERWNGKAWSIQAIPQPAKRTWFFGVSCSTPWACTAVGYQNNGTGDAQPFAEAWNGTRWCVLTVPLPHGAPGGALSAVSCTSPGACTATGTSFLASGPTLAERWNGRSWRVQPTPNPANYRTSFGEVALDGVSCTSARACTASGEYSPGGLAAYFLEAWNGSSWRLVTAPVPAHFVSGALLGMSCTAVRCTAVGAWTGGPAPQATLAMARSARSPLTAPRPAGAH